MCYFRTRMDHARFTVDEKRIRGHFEDMDYNHDESISLSEFNKMHLIYADM